MQIIISLSSYPTSSETEMDLPLPPRNNDDWTPPAWAKDFFEPPVEEEEEEERAPSTICNNIPGYNYRDYSTYVEDGGAMKKHKKSGNNFPARLHKILADEEYSHIISWMPHGRAWKVHNKRLFVEEVIPKYFGQSKFNSFTRQLSGWAFTRLQKVGPDCGCYYHECFLRGHPRLTVLMRRLSKTGESRDPPDVLMEPDFYAIDKEYPLQTCDTSSSSSSSLDMKVAVEENKQEDANPTMEELEDTFEALINELYPPQTRDNPASYEKEMQDICNHHAEDETMNVMCSAATATTNHHNNNSDATAGIQYPNPSVGNRVDHQGVTDTAQNIELHHVQHPDPAEIRGSFQYGASMDLNHNTCGIYRDCEDTNKYQFLSIGPNRAELPLRRLFKKVDAFLSQSVSSNPDEERFVLIATRYKKPLTKAKD